jgi:hypothetical protein
VQRIRCHVGEDAVFDLHFRDVCDDTPFALESLCHHVGLVPEQDYLERCRSVVWTTPKSTRSRAAWSARDFAEVARLCDRYPSLARYRADIEETAI